MFAFSCIDLFNPYVCIETMLPWTAIPMDGWMDGQMHGFSDHITISASVRKFACHILSYFDVALSHSANHGV